MKFTALPPAPKALARPQRRRALGQIAQAGALLAGATVIRPIYGEDISGALPWQAGISAHALPVPVTPGPWTYFNETEVALVGAIADRLIPADQFSVGAVQAGVVVFIDRQLSGPFGQAASQYRGGPFVAGTPEQGDQFRETPAQRYRSGLIAFDRACKQQLGMSFVALAPAQRDHALEQLETGHMVLQGSDGVALFNLILQNVREGFFADPMYGGNKDLAGWKMIGFPGARYDFRDVVDQRGKKLNIIPIAMLDRKS